MAMVNVAKLAGVSQATVSRVLTGAVGVRPETRQRVEQAIAKVGYELPPSRRRSGGNEAMRERAIRQIAVLVDDELFVRHGGFVITIFRGVQEAAAHEGIAVWLGSLQRDKGIDALASASGADGLLLIGAQADEAISRQSVRTPFVWLTSHAGAGADAVLPGNEAVGQMAAEYLIGRGHERLAFLNVDLHNPSYRVRGEAFERAVAASGKSMRRFVPPESASVPQRSQLASCDQLMDKLVRRLAECDPRPTGLFVPSDFMTALAYRALCQSAITPGHDAEIVSCDNEEAYLAGLSPRPATFDVAGQERGRRAVYELLLQRRFPEERRSVQLTVEPRLVMLEEAK